jgi:hypothetical protein
MVSSVFHKGNDLDIQTYVHHELAYVFRSSTWRSLKQILLWRSKGAETKILKQILDMARDNFLWTYLAVRTLKSSHALKHLKRTLTDLPADMQAMYDRMALSLTQSMLSMSYQNQELSQTILQWVTCALRPLSLKELTDALEMNILDMNVSIMELCGGFVTICNEERVSLIHETAQEYLTTLSPTRQSVFVNVKEAHRMLLERCLKSLTDPEFKEHVNSTEPPAFLSYSISAWPQHLTMSFDLEEPHLLEAFLSFLRERHMLTWIYAAVKRNDLPSLVTASQHLAKIVAKLRANQSELTFNTDTIAIIDDWATDLVRILGKFGPNLSREPQSILSLIPPFCPENSWIYRQFGTEHWVKITISGLTGGTTWDDSWGRFSIPRKGVIASVISLGTRIALLHIHKSTSHISIYNATTLEVQRSLKHSELVLSIQGSKSGEKLVSYGYKTTRVWNIKTGWCLAVVNNPTKRRRPHSIVFKEAQNKVVVCGEDRCIRSFNIPAENSDHEASTQLGWNTDTTIMERIEHDTVVNFPMCSALNSNATMVAFCYRNHPLTVWRITHPTQAAELVGQCYISYDQRVASSANRRAFLKMFRVAWHPSEDYVFGMDQVGFLCRWDPTKEESVSPNACVQTGGSCMALSADGSIIATGDAMGIIKIFRTRDFAIIYQNWSRDPVKQLSFGTDATRLYDNRGTYGNIWQQSELLELVNSDTGDDTSVPNVLIVRNKSMNNGMNGDKITSMSYQPQGLFYAYGTDNGVANLCKVGQGIVQKLAKISSSLSIEQMAWSWDGQLVAFADLSRKVHIKSLETSELSQVECTAEPVWELVIPHDDNNIIEQLMFHPDERKLFVATRDNIYSIDIHNHTYKYEALPAELQSLQGRVKWAYHPMNSSRILAFTNSQLHVFSCEELREVKQYRYLHLPMGTEPEDQKSLIRLDQLSTDESVSETLGRLILRKGSQTYY